MFSSSRFIAPMALTAAFSAHADTGTKIYEAIGSKEFIEKSNEYSSRVVSENDLLQDVLKGVGVSRLNELNPDLVYTLNKRTGSVTSMPYNHSSPSRADASRLPSSQPTPLLIPTGYLITSVDIDSARGAAPILGEASTRNACFESFSEESVSGFMATQQQRDPLAGTRDGIVTSTGMLGTVVEVDFSITKLQGGAKNPANRTTMETTHTAECGDQFQVRNLVSTWPPLRVQMVMDDTGSMGEEISGLKSAISNFIVQAENDFGPGQTDYELITFKDSPTIDVPLTQDASAMIAGINAVSASGGNDCPEDSIGALNLALNSIENGPEALTDIVFATDASPRSGSMGAVISKAQALGVRVNVLQSGICPSAASATASLTFVDEQSQSSVEPRLDREVALVSNPSDPASLDYQQLAEDTGGTYIYAPNATPNTYDSLFSNIFEGIVDADPSFSCEFSRLAGWGERSQHTMNITNISDSPKEWFIEISYPSGHFVENSWQINRDGGNPAVFTATNSGILQPNETYYFGFQTYHGSLGEVEFDIEHCGE